MSEYNRDKELKRVQILELKLLQIEAQLKGVLTELQNYKMETFQLERKSKRKV